MTTGAWAALHSGYRGNVYEGPGKGEAISKLKKMYDAENLPTPSEAAKKETKPSIFDQVFALIRGKELSVTEKSTSLEQYTRNVRNAWYKQFNTDYGVLTVANPTKNAAYVQDILDDCVLS